MQTKMQYISTRKNAASVPLGNFDIFEDENTLINRLYYAVPEFEDGQFRCSFYYEENTFRKEPNGDLTLVDSEYGIDNPLTSQLTANE